MLNRNSVTLQIVLIVVGVFLFTGLLWNGFAISRPEPTDDEVLCWIIETYGIDAPESIGIRDDCLEFRYYRSNTRFLFQELPDGRWVLIGAGHIVRPRPSIGEVRWEMMMVKMYLQRMKKEYQRDFDPRGE